MASDKSKILRLKAWENLLKARKDLITAARQERIAMKASCGDSPDRSPPAQSVCNGRGAAL
jgi:hypothetical protein